MQKKYRSEIVSIVNPIFGVYTVEFKSLNGRYKYHPGQFLHLAIDVEYDGSTQWPESRCFSMQSNPEEETIKITYSVKGSFTKQMEETLKVGSEVWLKLPYGDIFQQYHNKEKTVFIAGGTGITPFLSLFTHESFNEYINPKIYLGFRSKEFNIYSTELNSLRLRANSEQFCITYFYQDIEGVIDIEKIFLENKIQSNYFISGPPAMIKTFKQTLIDKGVPVGNVLIDEWV
jgi:ferredoxin-NADP reductase